MLTWNQLEWSQIEKCNCVPGDRLTWISGSWPFLKHVLPPDSHLYKLMCSLISWTDLSWFILLCNTENTGVKAFCTSSGKIRRGQHIPLMRGCTTYMYIVLVIRSSPNRNDNPFQLERWLLEKSFLHWAELLKLYFTLIPKHLISSFR